MQKRKISYFLSHPIQYFSPLLKEMAKVFDLEVYYYSDAGMNSKNIDKGFGQSINWDTPLLEGYQYVFLKNFSKRQSVSNHFFDVFNPGIVQILRKKKSSVIIVNGWIYSSTLLAIFFGRILGNKIWLRAESPLSQEVKKTKLILFCKRIVLKQILFRFFVSKCLYIGTENRKFFEFYGVPESKMIYTPYAVDNDFFSDQYRRMKGEIPFIKRELKIPENKKIILFTGKYIVKKNPLDLLRAFHQLNNSDYVLMMVGDGPMRSEMEKYIAINNLQGVYLTGFINQTMISKYYAIADVFVMCSGLGETWGLSVNEAMNFEKPIIVSKTCGCSSDLVRPGVNGYVFNEGNVNELKEFLNKTLGDDEFRSAAGKKSAEIIKSFSISQIVHNMQAADNFN
jgi:glycosyltransferase involved in cell wall biosynthesis